MNEFIYLIHLFHSLSSAYAVKRIPTSTFCYALTISAILEILSYLIALIVTFITTCLSPSYFTSLYLFYCSLLYFQRFWNLSSFASRNEKSCSGKSSKISYAVVFATMVEHYVHVISFLQSYPLPSDNMRRGRLPILLAW